MKLERDLKIYRRLVVISLILFVGLAVFCMLGLKAIDLHAEGLAARRSGEFIEVAEQIRLDVSRKLDDFVMAEQRRPFTDYQYTYIPEDNLGVNTATLTSPLNKQFSNDLAYGYFQIDSEGAISSPHKAPGESDTAQPVISYLQSVENVLLPSLDGVSSADARRVATVSSVLNEDSYITDKKRFQLFYSRSALLQQPEASPSKQAAKGKGSVKSRTYPIETFNRSAEPPAQVVLQSRDNVTQNLANTQRPVYQMVSPQQTQADGGMVFDESNVQARIFEEADQAMDLQGLNWQLNVQTEAQTDMLGEPNRQYALTGQEIPQAWGQQQNESGSGLERQMQRPDQSIQEDNRESLPQQAGRPQSRSDTVPVRIEPFVPVIVQADKESSALFNGQIFLLRHVQIEQNHLLQGFRLDQDRLLDEIQESARRFVRSGMRFEVSSLEDMDSVHSAILDFGFGDLVLNLFEVNPGWIGAQIFRLRAVYFAITAVVILAVILALVSLGRNLHAQVKLARKKDDFISAVSHELRTPLTSIRMYTEMLEKDWIKSEDKRRQYYSTMRQETERLSRLIENVLDFSRIQRKKKKFHFVMGDLNQCIQSAVDMLAPCAARAGFELRTELIPSEPVRFDKDAVCQIVINLLDNAIKYAAGAKDKVIVVRTVQQDQHVLLEVEDHGPGIPRKLHEKVFEEFYRCGDERTRETTGTGLGLALVKRFVQAHAGFVDILSAKPSGTIFRIGLPLQTAG